MLITNMQPEHNLIDRLENLIAESVEMRVLVGFFYFWGITDLYKGLFTNPQFTMKILVGLRAGDHAGAIVEFAEDHEGATDQEKRTAFLESLRTVLRGPHMDTQKFYERASLFVDLVQSGKIEIRKTREPNHAKLYHFTFRPTLAQHLGHHHAWITGSSNLTRPGLTEQHELNVQIMDFGGGETCTYFDALWNTAVPLTEDPETKERIIQVVDGDESILAEVTPFEAYALVLKNYLEHRQLVDKTPTIERVLAESKDLHGNPKYRSMSFQVDAINQALSILQSYNGVIIADVVGLGKSIVGSVLGRVTGKRGIVIAPPGLIGDAGQGTGWWGYLEDFGLKDWRAVSRGKLDEVLEMVNRQRDFEMVIIDEAHYFRNEDCEDYHYLSQICRGKQVILMTATPYSNRPSDVLSLLKLFTPVRQSLLTPDGNIEALFRDYQIRYTRIDYVLKYLEDPIRAEQVQQKLEGLGISHEVIPGNYEKIRHATKAASKQMGSEIRQVIEPVMIRRNRLDLKGDPDYAAEVGDNLPTMNDPIEQFYELSPEQSRFYDLVITEYFGEESRFTGAIYQPGAYTASSGSTDDTDDEEGDDRRSASTQQRNMYKFIRRLLVRRFESSFGAFVRTLENLIVAHTHVRSLATLPPQGRGVVVLDRKLMEKLLTMEDAEDSEIADILQREIDLSNLRGRRDLQVFDVAKDFNDDGRARFYGDLDADIALLEQVKDDVAALELIANDPKALKLVGEITAVHSAKHPQITPGANEPSRKVLVFSEFGDTVDHVRGYLEVAFPGRVLTIRSLNKSTAQAVRENFDAGIAPVDKKDQYDILLATDKMSEGFNLNRAGLVINYDIPWNPTRVIQRIGRINRIGNKVFEDLYLFNFFPTEQGKDQHNVRQIASNKMFMIHSSIGEDARIFDTGEEPTPAGLFEKLSRNPDTLEDESFLTQAKREWAEIRKDHPEIVEKLNRLPGRVKSAECRTPDGVYLFARRGMTLFALRTAQGTDDGPILHLSLHEAIDSIRTTFDSPRCDGFSDTFWQQYEGLQESLTERRHRSTPGSGSLIVKARNVLAGAVASGTGGPFARTLLEDIRNFGSLAERTLRKIVDASRDTATLTALLDELKNEMGENYLDPLRNGLPEGEVVIAIEHRMDVV
jgi:hypothetical protein